MSKLIRFFIIFIFISTFTPSTVSLAPDIDSGTEMKGSQSLLNQVYNFFRGIEVLMRRGDKAVYQNYFDEDVTSDFNSLNTIDRKINTKQLEKFQEEHNSPIDSFGNMDSMSIWREVYR